MVISVVPGVTLRLIAFPNPNSSPLRCWTSAFDALLTRDTYHLSRVGSCHPMSCALPAFILQERGYQVVYSID